MVALETRLIVEKSLPRLMQAEPYVFYNESQLAAADGVDPAS